MEIKKDENEKEDIKNEDINEEDIKNEVIKKEDIKKEDIKKEDIKKEDIKNEDIKKEDIKNEDIKKEDIKKEDKKNDEIKIDEKKNDEIKNDDIKNEECIFEVYKSENYDKVIPNLIKSIEVRESENKTSEDYPYFIPNKPIKYLPKLNQPSEIINDNQLKELHVHFPFFHQYPNLEKIFSITEDGCSIKTLYKKCEGIKNTLLLIKDEEKNVFGAYASDVIAPTSLFYGSSDCFVFTFYKEDKLHIYKSTDLNEKYMFCDYKKICFGNNYDDFSLCLMNDLSEGNSKRTITFNNKVLNGKDKFIIAKLEIWGFQ